MNEFLQANLAELVSMVTRLIESGVSLGKEHLPELLKQMVSYQYIQYKVVFTISIVFIILSFLAVGTGVHLQYEQRKSKTYNDSDVATIVIGSIVLVPSLIALGISYTGMMQCEIAPMAVILQTLRSMKI